MQAACAMTPEAREVRAKQLITDHSCIRRCDNGAAELNIHRTHQNLRPRTRYRTDPTKAATPRVTERSPLADDRHIIKPWPGRQEAASDSFLKVVVAKVLWKLSKPVIFRNVWNLQISEMCSIICKRCWPSHTTIYLFLSRQPLKTDSVVRWPPRSGTHADRYAS